LNDQAKGAKMKQYKQLDQEQRYHISGLLKAGWNQTKIAAERGVDKATISRELYSFSSIANLGTV
jgi:IS30 family transposase